MNITKTIVIGCVFLFPFSAFPASYISSPQRNANITQQLDKVQENIENNRNAILLKRRQNYEDAKRTYKKLTSGAQKKYIAQKQDSFYMGIGGNRYHIHYREINANTTPDKDTGWLGGYYLNLGYISSYYVDFLKSRPFLEAYYRYSRGELQYDGGTQSGLPFQFKEGQEIYRYGVKLGGRQSVGKDKLIYGYFDLGQRVWFRGQTGIAGYIGATPVPSVKEKYSWFYLGIGGGMRYLFDERLTVGFEAELLYAPEDTADMHAADVGTFTLGTVWGLEFTFPLRYHLNDAVSLDVTPYYTFWRINNSESIPIGGGWFAHEPSSNTHVLGLLFGLTYSFF